MTPRYALFKRPLGLAIMAFLMLLALGLPQLALAQTTSGGSQFQFASNDYFINVILKGILGDIINSGAANAQATISGPGTLGEVFRTFNLGVAFFGSLMVIFISVVGILNSGNDGQFLGQKWSSMWVPVRFAAGSALMLPLTSSGYSYCQAMVIWIALQGVGFADTLWTSIVKGVAVKNGYTLTAAYDGDNILRQIAVNRTCVELVNAVNAGLPADQRPNDFGMFQTTSTSNGETKVTYNWGDGTAGENTAVCGSLTFNWKSDNDPYINIRKAIADANIAAVNQYDAKYKTATAALITKYLADADTGGGNYSPVADISQLMAVISADSIAYTSSLAQKANAEMAAAGYQTTQKNSEAAMTQYGFAMAGMWYIELLKAHNVARQSLQSPQLAGPSVQAILGSEIKPKLETLLTAYDKFTSSTRSTNYDTQVASSGAGAGAAPGTTKVTKFNLKASDFADTSIVANLTGGLASFLRESLFGVGPGNSVWVVGGAATSHDPNVSTILQLKDKGDTILDAAGVLMTLHMGGEIIVGASNAASSSLAGVGLQTAADLLSGGTTMVAKVGAYIIDKLGPYIFGAVSALTLLGMTLSIVIPMMPYVIWTGALLGFVVLIVEGLIAIMLWAVMMMHPSGEGITSHYNQQGLNMMLAIFMRPALLLMGLVTGMFMVEPMVGFVNDTFSFAMGSMQSHTISGLFTIIGSIGIYISLVLVIVEKSFGMIHLVADRVLTWIGGQGALTGEETEMRSRGDTIIRSAQGGLNTAVLSNALSKKEGSPKKPLTAAEKRAARRAQRAG